MKEAIVEEDFLQIDRALFEGLSIRTVSIKFTLTDRMGSRPIGIGTMIKFDGVNDPLALASTSHS